MTHEVLLVLRKCVKHQPSFYLKFLNLYKYRVHKALLISILYCFHEKNITLINRYDTLYVLIEHVAIVPKFL